MKKVVSQDPHTASVETLVTRGDWAGLLRWWIAHQYPPALKAAVQIGRNLATERGGAWQLLARYLGEVAMAPLQQRNSYPARLRRICNPIETSTLDLLLLFPIASWCERAGKVPPSWQERFLHIGIRGATSAVRVSRSLKDSALEAYFLWLLGTASAELHRFGEARQYYHQVIRITQTLAKRHPAIYCPHLAITFNSLGVVQRHLNLLPEARRSFRNAIAQHGRLAAVPSTTLQVRLARCWSNLGNIEDELRSSQQALGCHQRALDLWRVLARRKPVVYQGNLAQAYDNSGICLRSIGALPEAQRYFRKAVTIYQQLPQPQREKYRPDLGRTLNNLGNLQGEWNQFEKALLTHQEAVSIFRELSAQRAGTFGPELARSLSNLGITLSALNRFEDALAVHQEAAAIYRDLRRCRRGFYQAESARSLNNLANVQRRLGHVSIARNNYRDTVKLYGALAKRYPTAYRPDLATALGNLGGILITMNAPRPAHLAFCRAVAYFRSLGRHRPRVYRHELARCLSNLGNVVLERGWPRRALSVQTEAVAIYRALAKRDAWLYRPHLARCLNNRGNALRRLGRLRRALRCYQEAQELYSRHARSFPWQNLFERQQCWTSLGAFYRLRSPRCRLPNLVKARHAFRHAQKCGDELRRYFLVPEYRQQLQGEVMRAYELLIHTCVELAATRSDATAMQEAVATAEAARARNLADMLEDEVLRPDHTPASVVATYRKLRRRWRRLAAALSAVGNGGVPTRARSRRRTPSGGTLPPYSVTEEFRRLRTQEQKWLQKIRTEYDPEFDPDHPIHPVTFETIQSLLPSDGTTAVVQYAVTMERTFAFVITCTGVNAVTLPHLSSAEIAHLAAGWHDHYHNQTRFQYLAARQAAEATALKREMAKAAAFEDVAGELARRWTQEWEESIPRLLSPITARAVQPVLQALSTQTPKRIIICPNRGLHVFPLHACRLPDGRFVADQFEVVYTPSLSVLHHCLCRRRPRPRRLLLVANPTADLRFAEVEGLTVRHWFRDDLVIDVPAANKEEFLRLCQASDVLHYTGHAKFSLAQPLDSALVLGNQHEPGQWLSLREIFRTLKLPRNSLTVLNGCETGMLLPDMADDYVNLVTGFLYGGAKCVISTLWSVPDLSSALLMSRFYSEWRSGSSPATALREAQRWLRCDIADGNALMTTVLPTFLNELDDTILRQRCEKSAQEYAERFPSSPPFASPAHWAAYTAVGAAYGR